MFQIAYAYLLRKAARASAQAEQWKDTAARYAALRQLGMARASDAVRHARAVEAMGDRGSALALHDQNVALFPLSSNVHRQRAVALLNRGDEAGARLELAQAYVLVDDDMAQQTILSAELERLGVKESDAIAVALAAFHVGPQPAPAAPGRLTRYRAQRIARGARDLRQAGDWAGAIRLHEKVLALTPNNGPIHIRQGHALKAQGRMPEAVRSYWRGVALAPANPDSYLQLGHALKLNRSKDAALPAYLLAYAIQPDFQDLRGILGDYGLSESDASNLADKIAKVDTQQIVGASGLLAALESPTVKIDVGPAMEPGEARYPARRRSPSRDIDVRTAAIAGDIGRAVGVFV